MGDPQHPDNDKRNDGVHIGNVMGGIRDSIIAGRDVIVKQFFTLPFWIKAAVAIIMILVVIILLLQAVGIYVISQPPPVPTPTPVPPMTGDFNVAVAQFDVSGQGPGLDAAQNLAQNFSNAIQLTIDELELGLPEIRPPLLTGVITGTTVENRAEYAKARAEESNADVLIYGSIVVDDLRALVEPEFYISKSRNDGLIEADEITGQYRMGLPIPLERVTNRNSREEAVKTLSDRFGGLTSIVDGLSDYIVGDYADAENRFAEALEITAWNNPEVVHVLMGNALLKQDRLTEAEGHYRMALDKNDRYARAHVGLGSALHLQATGSGGLTNYAEVDMEILGQAIDAYLQALDAEMEHPPKANIKTKANLGLGQAYFVQALAALYQQQESLAPVALANATAALDSVIQDYADGQNPQVQELAAHAHAHRGLLHRIGKRSDLAIKDYLAAYDLLPNLTRTRLVRASYAAVLGELYAADDQMEKAREWYGYAVADAPAESDERSRYEERLDELQ